MATSFKTISFQDHCIVNCTKIKPHAAVPFKTIHLVYISVIFQFLSRPLSQFHTFQDHIWYFFQDHYI